MHSLPALGPLSHAQKDELRFTVTEHRAMQARGRCAQIHRGQCPAQASAAVQYGPQALATMVHLNPHPMVPAARTAALMRLSAAAEKRAAY